jgi:hypothetical protein
MGGLQSNINKTYGLLNCSVYSVNNHNLILMGEVHFVENNNYKNYLNFSAEPFNDQFTVVLEGNHNNDELKNLKASNIIQTDNIRNNQLFFQMVRNDDSDHRMKFFSALFQKLENDRNNYAIKQLLNDCLDLPNLIYQYIIDNNNNQNEIQKKINNIASNFKHINSEYAVEMKNFLPLSLKKKVTNIVLNQQFDKNCTGGINLVTSKCLDAFRLCNNAD